MNFVIVLVSSEKPLSAGHLADAEKFAAQNGIMVTGTPSWLDQNKAADIPVSECLNIEQINLLRQKFDNDKIDVFCTRTENRYKELLIADMDSTIVTSETLDELAAEAGLKEKISKITAKAMKGELDFEGALKERVSLLEGLPTDALKRTLDATEISEGAERLVQEMRQKGAFCALVSGGFTYFTSAVAAQLGFTAHHGNSLEIENEKLTGQVKEPILDKNAKLRFLKLYCEELEMDIGDSVAIGDGANDLPMLLAAGLGVGYKAKPLVEESVLNCIRHTDLKSVLYIQGYKLLS
jgi:phosphoserine phosphatase